MQRTFSFSGFSEGDASEPTPSTQRRADLAKTLSNLTPSSPIASPQTPQPRSNTSRKLAYSSTTTSLTADGSAIDDEDDDDTVRSVVTDMGGLNMSVCKTEEMGDRLQQLVLGMRNKLISVRPIGDRYADHLREDEVDGAYGHFAEVGSIAGGLCRGLLEATHSNGHTRSTSDLDVCLERVRGRRTVDIGEISGIEQNAGPVDAKRLNLVREWRACLDELAAALKICLTCTYKRHEQFATPQILEALFADRKSRSQVVCGWMKNFGAHKRMQGRSGVWTKWETRFQNYDQVVQSLSSLTILLQSCSSGTTPDRVIQDIIIAPQGDTILEFANSSMTDEPVLRFRVSSHMLSATSPIFARMFVKAPTSSPAEVDIDEALLPPPPTPFVSSDGSRVHLYRMPQLEYDTHSSLTILLHAAHLHNAHVPRTIAFEQFIALAEASLRYRCTSPLEIYVEHRWLPQWMHKATEEMPYGWVVIAYAFGLRRLFSRTTKSIILHCKTEAELESTSWPVGVKEKIWRVREAKMAQVWEVCSRTVGEYLPHSLSAGVVERERMDMEGETVQQEGGSLLVGPPGSCAPSTLAINGNSSMAINLTSKPRCPKGYQWCDATNVGWLMLAFHQLQTTLPPRNLATIPSSPSNPVPSISSQTPSTLSLTELITALRSIPSPPQHPAHTGAHSSVCDPVSAFRAAINDVYNSVTGLTLFEIDGKRHGWGLSGHRKDELEEMGPGGVLRLEMEVDGDAGFAVDVQMTDGMEPSYPSSAEGTGRWEPSVADKIFSDGDICRRVLSFAGSLSDLHALAAANRRLYEVYKQHELVLMRNAIRASRRPLPHPPSKKEKPKRPPPCQEPTQTVDRCLRKLLDHSAPTSRHTKALSMAVPRPLLYASISPAGTTTPTSPTPAGLRSPAPSYLALSSRLSTRSRSSSMNPYFKLTEEEARQILWPEPSPPVMPQLSTVEVTAFGSLNHGISEEREVGQFGGGGSLRGMVEEDKCLVVEGNKQLREDIRRRVGLI